MSKWVSALFIVTLTVGASTACATKKFVRTNVGEVNGKVELRLDLDVPVPVPGAGEVLLAVRACGLNQVDLLTRDGQTPQPPKLPPYWEHDSPSPGTVCPTTPRSTWPAGSDC